MVSASERDLGKDTTNPTEEAKWIDETDRKNNNERAGGDREEANKKILEKYEYLPPQKKRHPEEAWAEKQKMNQVNREYLKVWEKSISKMKETVKTLNVKMLKTGNTKNKTYQK